MHRFIVASLAAAGLSVGWSAAAFAADLSPSPAPTNYTKAPIAPPHSWTGFYAGVSGGFGWSGDDVEVTGSPTVAAAVNAGAAIANASAGAVSSNFAPNPKGFIGGGQVGYNYQTGQFVWGVETDLSWADIKGDASQSGTAPVVGFPPFVINSSGTAEQHIDAFGTLRARLGFTPVDPLLLYGTGGLAYGHVESNTNLAETLTPSLGISFSNAVGSASAWQAGWTAGAGAEYAFAPHWTVKAEYLYYDLGTLKYNSTLTSTAVNFPVFTAAGVSSNADFKGNIVRAGINYRF
jgi:outer membrane immunogenic protein